MVLQQRKTLVGDQMLFSKSKRGMVTKHTAKVLTMDRERFKRRIMPDGSTRPWNCADSAKAAFKEEAENPMCQMCAV
jgi:hypothetical protein